MMNHPRVSRPLANGLARVSVCAALVLISGAAASARTEVGQPFGREGTVKIRVPGSALPPGTLQVPGTSLVARYESFAIIEAPAGAANQFGADAEVLPRENKILLNAGALDTTTAKVKALRHARGDFKGKAMHMVQFAAAVQPAWYDQMLQSGVQVVTAIPSNAYLVYGSHDQIQKLQTAAAGMPQVQWEGEYLDQYKIDPGAVKVMRDSATNTQRNLQFAIQLVKDPAANADTLKVIDVIRSGPITEDYDILNYHNVVVSIPPAALSILARQQDIVSIQPYVTPQLYDERQNQIVAGNLTGNLPSGPGYMAWLTSKGFTQAQFNASGFCVDVTDSGIDNATTSPNHFGLYESGVRPGTSRIVYNRLLGTPNAGSTIQGCDGHGTLNTHIVLGYNTLATGFPHTDAAGYHYGLGVCPFTKAGSSVIFDPNTYTNPNFPSLMSQAYNNNARISTNSWGANVAGAYNTSAQAYDALVRDAQPTGSTVPAVGNQEMVIVFAAGNAGSGATTVGSPATGKNVITVGASENVQAFGGSDGCGEADTLADNANDMAPFSSRGPCADGRKKPEISAPGTHVSGGVAQIAAPPVNGTHNACYNGSGVCGGVASIYYPAGQEWYTASSGTSHSTPCVSGGAALVRQFFINNSQTPPSPAMTKAFLCNSARYMNGTGANDTLWSNSQGMGEMNLGEAFNRIAVTPTFLRDELAADMFTASGQTRIWSGTIADSTKPVRISLAWTDTPGPTAGAAYVNNLDLTVQIGANVYKGNVFSGANSITGGAADTQNNMESVFIPAGVSGAITITVTATNIAGDGVPNVGGSLDQDFALVAYNATGILVPTTGACCLGAPTYACSLLTNSGCTSQGGTYAGDNVTCAAANCPPPPTGACCAGNGSCSVLTQLACTTAGGIYAGNNVTCAAAGCTATNWAEVGDAGDTPGTAQQVTGPGNAVLQYITGSIGTSGDADVYKIRICNEANFLATTAGNTTTADTQLFLFDAAGKGVAMDDDDTGATNTLQSRITTQFVTANGDYFLGITFYNNDPHDAANALLWNNQNNSAAFGPEWAPNGPGAANAWATYDHAATSTGAYRIDLIGACFSPAACYANCDGSTTPPVLTANDFQCFLNRYAANDTYANCDGSTTAPVLTANDFQCFLNAYASGCP